MRKVTGVQRPQKKSQGGMLQGPSHEQGGIPAVVGGTTPVELEGGEYIVNAQTVNAIGQPFLDKLNSTQTEYHTGGYERGQLPGPSQFDRGGRVNKRKKLQAGGTPGVVYNPGPERGFQNINKLRNLDQPCPAGMYKVDGACAQYTGNQNVTGGGNTNPGAMRAGGRVNSPQKMQSGGVVENKKLSNKSIAKRQYGGGISKPTSKSTGVVPPTTAGIPPCS